MPDPWKAKDYWIKPRKQLLEYQISVFSREIKGNEARYEKLIANQEKRKESYGLEYDTQEEIFEAYTAGLIDDKTARSQRAKHWLVYSDRGYKAKLSWLHSELEVYQKQYDALMQIIEQKRANTLKRWSDHGHRKQKTKKYKKEQKKRRQEKKEQNK